jgi:uncharacterized protein
MIRTRFLKWFIILAVCGYFGLVGAMYIFQRALVFNGPSSSAPFESLDLPGARAITLDAPEGAKLAGYYRPADAGQKTIIFFHGKGAEISIFARQLKFYGDRGFGYIGLSYRGHGDSTGDPTEELIISDAVLIYDWLLQQGVDNKQIVALGTSFGTGVAVQLASRRPVAAVALAAPYTATVDVAAEVYWYVPVRYLMKDRFESREHIKNINAPLIIVHGGQDRTVPFKFGKALYEMAIEPKTFVPIEDIGHRLINTEFTWTTFAEFFDALPAK